VNAIPLYLHAEEPLQVTYREPALCIKAENRSDRIYPLRRIERIQVSGPVEWRTEALLACADKGISIHFINRQGETRGRLVGVTHNRQNLAEQLQHLLNQPDWERRYHQWCWAMGLQTQRYVANRLGYKYRDARELTKLPKWCADRLSERVAAASADKSLQWLHQDLYGLVTQKLHQRGAWRDSILMLNKPVDLAHDLTSILQWLLLIIREQQIQHYPDEAITRCKVAGWCVNQARFLDYQVARIIARFELWIMEDN
jgi:hypothetical protein